MDPFDRATEQEQAQRDAAIARAAKPYRPVNQASATSARSTALA